MLCLHNQYYINQSQNITQLQKNQIKSIRWNSFRIGLSIWIKSLLAHTGITDSMYRSENLTVHMLPTHENQTTISVMPILNDISSTWIRLFFLNNGYQSFSLMTHSSSTACLLVSY